MGGSARHMVAVVVLEGTGIFELAVPSEVFGGDRSELADPWYDLRLCTIEPGKTQLASGFSVESPCGLSCLAEADTVIVPACSGVPTDPPDALLDVLQGAHARGARIAAICCGAFVLAAAGLLAGRRATSHWLFAEELGRRHPDVRVDPSALYTQDGTIFTAAGAAAALDLCLELVRLDHGVAVANLLARRIVAPPHRAAEQSQYVETPLPAPAKARGGDGLAAVLDWALARLDQPLTRADMAQAINVSPRTLARRFQESLAVTPAQWLLNQRVRLAQELLETTDEPVEEVARLAGLGTGGNLRQQLTRATGLTPIAYRRSFRSRTPTPGRGPRSADGSAAQP